MEDSFVEEIDYRRPAMMGLKFLCNEFKTDQNLGRLGDGVWFIIENVGCFQEAFESPLSS